jgi:hypothetical protein
VVSETYILPFGVKAIALTESQHHITGKSMVLITSQNKIYNLQDLQFSARRPHPEKPAPLPTSFKEALNAELEKAKEEEKEVLLIKSDKFPMYDPVIPQVNTKFLTYDLQLTNLDKIQTFSSRLESTTQVFAYGHDLFLARVKPDGSFDLLDEEFNFTLLFGVIGLILVANVYGAVVAKKETLKTQFLTL